MDYVDDNEKELDDSVLAEFDDEGDDEMSGEDEGGDDEEKESKEWE